MEILNEISITFANSIILGSTKAKPDKKDLALIPEIEKILDLFEISSNEGNPQRQVNSRVIDNILKSWPDNIPIFNYLTSKKHKIAFINYAISTKDDTNKHEYIPGDFTCHEFSLQTYIQFTNNNPDLSRLSQKIAGRSLPAKYHLPIYIFSYSVGKGQGGHDTNAVLIGKDKTNLADWYFIELQTDRGIESFEVPPRSYVSFSAPKYINGDIYDYDGPHSLHFYLDSDGKAIGPITRAQGAVLLYIINLDPSEFASRILDDNETGTSYYSTKNLTDTFKLGIENKIFDIDYVRKAVQAMQECQKKKDLEKYLLAMSSNTTTVH